MPTKSISYYPISLDEIKHKVGRKNGRKKPSNNQILLLEDSDYPNSPFRGCGKTLF